MNAAEAKLDFIKTHVAAGRTVYLSTALRHTVIANAKHLALVRVKGNNLQIQMGKQGWLNYDYAKLTAQ